MSNPAPVASPVANPRRRRSRMAGPGSTLLAEGEPMVWLTGGALVIALTMIVGLLTLVFWLGSTTFVVGPLVQLELLDGTKQLGEVSRSEQVPLTSELIFREPPVVHRQIMIQLLAENAQATWQALPAEIEAQAKTLRQDAVEVGARLTAEQNRLKSLAAARPPVPESPAARAQWIRNNTQAEALLAASQQVETLTARQEALLRQAATADAVAQDLQKKPDAVPLTALTSLDEDAQTVVVDALLVIRARQLREPHLSARRRLLRTGNFDVTQTHFAWVADYQLKPQGESQPEWAMLVERFEDGHFFGFPEALVVRHLRPIGADEKQLDDQIAMLARHAETLKAGPRKETFAKALDVLRAERSKLQREQVALFLSQFSKEPDSRELVQVTTSGRTIPFRQSDLKATPDDDPVVEARETFTGPAEAWKHFEIHHADVLSRRQQCQAMEQEAAGRSHQAVENARLRCKQAEIRQADGQRHQPLKNSAAPLKLPVFDLAQRLTARQREVAEAGKQVAAADAMVARLRKLYGAESPPAQAAQLVAADLRASEARLRAQPEVAALQQQLTEEPEDARQAVQEYLQAEQSAQAETAAVAQRMVPLKAENDRYVLRMKTAQKAVRPLRLDQIVRAIPSNRLTAGQKASIYFGRWWEFLSAAPRNGNSEGGVFPAIFGTVVMTLLMSLAVVPFGVLAALYLREYAKAGPIVSIIRISINNLAGVPSIVFGVFGLGFFCYVVGAYIDGGPRKAQFATLPLGTWLTLTTLAAVMCVVAFTISLFGLAARRAEATRRQRVSRILAGVLWVAATLLVVYLVATTPLFNGLYRAHAPNPKFGTGGLLWASLTLALLTLPVVIVATEEALSAVPNSMREGSYGCGASRWQTIRRVVLPQALPGIMTGMILAMARGAGEVAPLMLVGAVHSAPVLPVDTTAPFVHAERSFMHLGYHIYYLGFQSQNSQAAMPMVFTTTLLLIAIVATLNITAMWLRARLRRRFQQGQF